MKQVLTVLEEEKEQVKIKKKRKFDGHALKKKDV